MTDILWLVIRMVGGLLATACILRALAYRFHLSPHNPISQFVNAVTDWIVKPLRRVLPPSRDNDWASVLAAVLLALVIAIVYMLLLGRMPMPGFVLLMAVSMLIEWVLYLMIGMLILQAVLSWVNPHAPIAPTINQLTQPFLAPIRKIVPLIGGVDLSPMVLMLIIYVLLEFVQMTIFRLAPYLT
ncbi:MAG: YggT family protein [Burkholderiaceae bacterium]